MGTFGSEFLIRASFLGKIPLLTRATFDDHEPTPGHLLHEINKLTYDSETVCHDIILWLNGRLTLNSTVVKLKVLKIMKYLVSKGHVNFKKILQKRSNEISEASKFGGISKSLDEMLKFSQVRKEANELLETLYAFHDDDEANTELPQALMGMGATSSNKMIGFGSSVEFKAESLTDTIYKNVSDLAEKISELSFSSKTYFYETNDPHLVDRDALQEDSTNIKDSVTGSDDRSIGRDNEEDVEKSILEQFLHNSNKSTFMATQVFVKKCKHADLIKLLHLISYGLKEGDVKDLIEYLNLIEILHRYGLVNYKDLYENYFDDISSLYQSDQNSNIKHKLKKVGPFIHCCTFNISIHLRCTPFTSIHLRCTPFTSIHLRCTPFTSIHLRCTPFRYY